MKVSELSKHALFAILQRGELCIDMFPFVVRVRSDISELAEDIGRIYQDFPVLDSNCFTDFHVEVSYERGVRRWFRPLARFYFDGRPSFIPLPVDQAFPMLEWGINWCVAAHSHSFLIVHAAVIERQGVAVVMPAPPGSGKSTLCAALIGRGWRLLSDELALYDFETKQLYGMARPVSLKNQSIPIIQAHTPAAEITSPVPDTTKGTVALLRPPSESVQQVKIPARPAWIILPHYQVDADALLEPLSKGKAFMLIAEQSFNYNVHGREGFEAVGDLVDSCECFEFTYSRLSDAERVFDDLLARRING